MADGASAVPLPRRAAPGPVERVTAIRACAKYPTFHSGQPSPSLLIQFYLFGEKQRTVGIMNEMTMKI